MTDRITRGASAVGLLALALASFAGAAAIASPQGQRTTEQRGNRVARKPPEEPKENLCNCYFSGDCLSGQTCYWGPGGPFTEDHCDWAAPKPMGGVGSGCESDTGLPGGCDGLCQNFASGSIPGSEEPTLVAFALDLWALSFLEPATQGGGLVDPKIAAAVFALPFQNENTAEILGRAIGGMFVIVAGQDFFHPDPALGIPAGHCAPGIALHVVADLTQSPWRVEALRQIVDALHCQMIGDVAGFEGALQRLSAVTPNTATAFQPICLGADAVVCVGGRVRDLAIALSTPRVETRR